MIQETVEWHVSVPQELILQGEPKEAGSCPIALSFWKAVEFYDKHITHVEVEPECISLSAGGYDFVADVPHDIQLWIENFDEKARPESEWDGVDEFYEAELRMNGILPVEFDLKFVCANIDQDEEPVF